MRIIFFAGKGGVGKTSVSAATGIKASEMGHRTVVMSLDVAHSLADIFDLDRELLDKNKGVPIEINKKLFIQELDIQEEIQRYWGDIHKYLSSILYTTGLDEVLAEELAVLPGMEEISLLLYINQYVKKKEFDVILLDCAPTGESLRFISIPTTLEWYMNKVFKLERTVVKYVRPVAKKVYDVPLPGDDYFKAIEDLFENTAWHPKRSPIRPSSAGMLPAWVRGAVTSGETRSSWQVLWLWWCCWPQGSGSITRPNRLCVTGSGKVSQRLRRQTLLHWSLTK